MALAGRHPADPHQNGAGRVAGGGVRFAKLIPDMRSAIGSSRNLEILVFCFYGKRTDIKEVSVPTLSSLTTTEQQIRLF